MTRDFVRCLMTILVETDAGSHAPTVSITVIFIETYFCLIRRREDMLHTGPTLGRQLRLALPTIAIAVRSGLMRLPDLTDANARPESSSTKGVPVDKPLSS